MLDFKTAKALHVVSTYLASTGKPTTVSLEPYQNM